LLLIIKLVAQQMYVFTVITDNFYLLDSREWNKLLRACIALSNSLAAFKNAISNIYYSQTRSSVPVASKLMNSLMEK